jgi:hypothetical protein
MHLPHSIPVQPNLELKTRPKQLLGSLPLDIVLPGLINVKWGSARSSWRGKIENKAKLMRFLSVPYFFSAAKRGVCVRRVAAVGQRNRLRHNVQKLGGQGDNLTKLFMTSLVAGTE